MALKTDVEYFQATYAAKFEKVNGKPPEAADLIEELCKVIAANGDTIERRLALLEASVEMPALGTMLADRVSAAFPKEEQP